MRDFKIANLRLPVYLFVAVVLIGAMLLDVLPANMIGAFLLLIVVGELLNLIGNHLPIVKTFFGGGPIVVIFGGAALVYFGVISEPIKEVVDNFMKNPGGFLDFYIAALITGSILGMNRELLLKAAVRFLPTIVAGVGMALALVAIVAPLVGESPSSAIAYIGIPIMGGGMGAGAVPISKVFAGALGLEAETVLSRLVPAVALGNAMAIVAGGMLDKLGKVKPAWTGNGQMMARGNFDVHTFEEKSMGVRDYLSGLVMATAFFTFGAIVAITIKSGSHALATAINPASTFSLNIHTYAWMIISVAIAKVLNIVPESTVKACAGWYNFVAKNFTAALMLGIGISYTDLGKIIEAFTLQYVVLCFFVIVGAILGTALIGKLMGFNPIEASLTAGLCMANMGGTGDVAVLTAANRMELMPFAQISSRIGGALIILLASVIVPIFFG